MGNMDNKMNDYDMEHILYMRAQLEHLFFKGFVRQYELPKGIKPTHAITMVILFFHPNESMSKLSNNINMEKGSITTVVDKLTKLGYVKSERSQKDRRVYNLNLTEKGYEFAEQFTSNHEAYIGSLIDKLDGDKKDDFFEAIETISNALEQLGSNLNRHKKNSK